MKDSFFYEMLRPLLTVFINLYRPTVIGKENIPLKENYILAGNHTYPLDPILVALSVKRHIHYFGKNSLFKGFKRPLFEMLGVIPVDRTKKDKNSLVMGMKALNENLVVGLFPEGTINRTKDIIMPFKMGAVKMAYETKKKIVPFAIVNKYKFLKKSVIIIYDKPYNVKSSDLEKENDILMKKIRYLIVKYSSEGL